MPATSVAVGLDHVIDKVEGLVDSPSKRAMRFAAGMAAKKAGQSAVALTLGVDMAMSNFKSGRVRLSVGFDDAPGNADAIILGHGPKGVWILADEGRKKSGPIYPRTGSRKGRKTTPGRAVKTPQGYRASSSYGRSRGKRTLRIAIARERVEAPKAAHEEFQRQARAVFGL